MYNRVYALYPYLAITVYDAVTAGVISKMKNQASLPKSY